MSVQSEITRLENAKAAIKAAIEGKGVTVPDATLLDGMAALIESIEAGGGDTQIDVLIDRTITEISNDRVTSIGQSAFQNCYELTDADFSAALSISRDAFRSCKKLTTVDFPAATSIDGAAFYMCSELTTANFPAATSIGGSAFYNCSKLTTANFPAATSIGGSAFTNCSKLTTANFPAATSIGGSAFYNCVLKALILRSETVATLSNISAFERTQIAYGTGYIYVPAALVDSYKAATNWSTYANQIRAIEDYPEITGGAA